MKKKTATFATFTKHSVLTYIYYLRHKPINIRHIKGLTNTLRTFFPLLCFAAFDMCTTNCSHVLQCESRQEQTSCTCQAGFSGLYCEVNIDDCRSNPCVNGKCEDGVNRYECVCDKGYWGTNCEKKIIKEGGRVFISLQ